jgi:predicted MFS family arabinose efflux permease
MALAGPAVQATVPAARRGIAGGIVVAGAGGGVIAGGLLVPVLLTGGLEAAWLGLALAVAAVWIAARPIWPNPPALPAAERSGPMPPAPGLLLAYGLSAAGMVAPMVYLADLGVRGHGLGVGGAALIWMAFGAGAIAGTLLGGRIAGRVGGFRALPWWMAAQVAALSAALVPWWPSLALAAPLGGFAGIGVTAVTLVAAREIAGEHAGVVWVRATAIYALAQAAFGFALAAVFAATGDSHAAVFGLGLLLSMGALLAALRARREKNGRSLGGGSAQVRGAGRIGGVASAREGETGCIEEQPR